MPEVSVIIPTYNRAEFLSTALRSVLNQSFGDLEILVVDDASRDHTAEIVESFHDPRIHYARHSTRRGGAAARNTGIRRARGRYIAFLDDDDEWLNDKLQKQIDLFSESPTAVGCVYSGYVTVDRPTGKLIARIIPGERGDLSRQLLADNCVGGTSCVMVKRRCFDDVGMFDERLPSFQDYDLWIRLSQKYRFEYITEPLLVYFFHQEQIWTNLESISAGIEIMLKKHGKSALLRRNLSNQYLAVGAVYCRQGHLGKAQEAFGRAIGLYPFAVRHYVNLALSLLGAKNFERVKQSSIWRAVSATVCSTTARQL